MGTPLHANVQPSRLRYVSLSTLVLFQVGPAISAAATAAAAATRQAAAEANKGTDSNASLVENAVAAAAAEAAAEAASAGGAEPGGGFVCRACGGPRFGRAVCAKCGANANS